MKPPADLSLLQWAEGLAASLPPTALPSFRAWMRRVETGEERAPPPPTPRPQRQFQGTPAANAGEGGSTPVTIHIGTPVGGGETGGLGFQTPPGRPPPPETGSPASGRSRSPRDPTLEAHVLRGASGISVSSEGEPDLL